MRGTQKKTKPKSESAVYRSWSCVRLVVVAVVVVVVVFHCHHFYIYSILLLTALFISFVFFFFGQTEDEPRHSKVPYSRVLVKALQTGLGASQSHQWRERVGRFSRATKQEQLIEGGGEPLPRKSIVYRLLPVS